MYDEIRLCEIDLLDLSTHSLSLHFTCEVTYVYCFVSVCNTTVRLCVFQKEHSDNDTRYK